MNLSEHCSTDSKIRDLNSGFKHYSIKILNGSAILPDSYIQPNAILVGKLILTLESR